MNQLPDYFVIRAPQKESLFHLRKLSQAGVTLFLTFIVLGGVLSLIPGLVPIAKVLATLPATPPISIPVTPVTHPLPVTAPLPVVIVSFDSEASLGSENVEFVNIEVKLNESTELSVGVDYAVTGGTAVKDEDFRIQEGTLMIEAGQRTGIIRLRVRDDQEVEVQETIQITLSNPVNAELGPFTDHTYTIVDND